MHLVKSKQPSAPASTDRPGAAPRPAGISAEQLSSVSRAADPLVQHLQSMGITGTAAQEQVDLMRRMMRTPEMQAMFSDPDRLSDMFRSNPVLQDMIRENPELGAMLNNREEMQRMMRIMADPELSRTFLRGMDLQLSNAEAHGAFAQMASASASVNRMMERMADDAALEADRQRTVDATAATAPTNNPFAALFQPQDTQSGGTGAAGPRPSGATGTAAGLGGFPGGLGGFGLPGGGGLGGMPELSPEMEAAVAEMMRNPAMREMMVQQWQAQARSNPMLREMAASNPMMAQLFENPDRLRAYLETLGDPETMAAMHRVRDAMARLDPGLAEGGNAPGLGLPAGLFGAGMPAMAPPADPETAYAAQLQQLQDMGFWDREANIRALVATQGNVNAAVERLLG